MKKSKPTGMDIEKDWPTGSNKGNFCLFFTDAGPWCCKPAAPGSCYCGEHLEHYGLLQQTGGAA